MALLLQMYVQCMDGTALRHYIGLYDCGHTEMKAANNGVINLATNNTTCSVYCSNIVVFHISAFG